MNLTRLRHLTFALMIGLFAACGDDDDNGNGDSVDTTPPTIELISPEQDATFEAGGQINFEAIFRDNVALSEYEIDIHDNFDGHGHGKIEAEGWVWKESFEISGTKAEESMTIDIPEDAYPGDYHFIVYCLDAAGNQAEFVEVDIEITSDATPPTLSVTGLKLKSDGRHYHSGEPIVFDIESADEQGIEEIEIHLKADDGRYLYDNHIRGFFRDNDYPTSDRREYRIEADDAGNVIPEGDYELEVEVINIRGLKTKVEFDIEVDDH